MEAREISARRQTERPRAADEGQHARRYNVDITSRLRRCALGREREPSRASSRTTFSLVESAHLVSVGQRITALCCLRGQAQGIDRRGGDISHSDTHLCLMSVCVRRGCRCACVFVSEKTLSLWAPAGGSSGFLVVRASCRGADRPPLGTRRADDCRSRGQFVLVRETSCRELRNRPTGLSRRRSPHARSLSGL